MIKQIVFMLIMLWISYIIMRVYSELWIWLANKIYDILMFLRIKIVGWWKDERQNITTRVRTSIRTSL